MIKPEEIWAEVLPQLREFLGQTDWDVAFIAELTDSSKKTVGDWLVETQPPMGSKLLALWHLLDVYGPPSSLMEGLQPYNRYIGQLMAFGVVTMDQAAEILGVKNSQTVIQVMRGQKPVKPKYTLPQLKERHDGDLQRKLSQLPRRNKRPSRVAVAVKDSTPPRVVQEVPSTPAVPTSLTLELSGIGSDPPLVLAVLLGAAVPLARHLNQSDDPAQRNRYRKLVGLDGLDDQLNELIALKSERARSNRR